MKIDSNYRTPPAMTHTYSFHLAMQIRRLFGLVFNRTFIVPLARTDFYQTGQYHYYYGHKIAFISIQVSFSFINCLCLIITFVSHSDPENTLGTGSDFKKTSLYYIGLVLHYILYRLWWLLTVTSPV